MDIHSLKCNEGKKVSIILKNNNVYSHIVYCVTTEGTITFKDVRSGEECYIMSDFIAAIREEAKWE